MTIDQLIMVNKIQRIEQSNSDRKEDHNALKTKTSMSK